MTSGTTPARIPGERVVIEELPVGSVRLEVRVSSEIAKREIRTPEEKAGGVTQAEAGTAATAARASP
eukprot:1806038-Pyramimonas_sp.AAC.1